MKRNHILILVAFMFTTFFSIMFNIVEGDERILVNELNNYSLDTEINKIKFQTVKRESENYVLVQRELEIKAKQFEEYSFDEAIKVENYFVSKEIENEIKIDNQIKKILELTPLDINTARIVIKYSKKYNFKPSFILGIMDLESNFNPYLVGTSEDRGYMQIIPSTEKWLVDTYGDDIGIEYDPSKIFEAEYNIALSVKYLSILRQEFGENYTKVLTAYNRGTGGMYKWYDENNTYETAYSRVILKREQKYIDVNM